MMDGMDDVNGKQVMLWLWQKKAPETVPFFWFLPGEGKMGVGYIGLFHKKKNGSIN